MYALNRSIQTGNYVKWTGVLSWKPPEGKIQIVLTGCNTHAIKKVKATSANSVLIIADLRAREGEEVVVIQEPDLGPNWFQDDDESVTSEDDQMKPPEIGDPRGRTCARPVSYTHLTLPTKRIV